MQWPHAGAWTLGFVAQRGCAWAHLEGSPEEEWVAVYIPTAPNPTSGYVVMVRASNLRPSPLRPDQALTWAVSGGVVAPTVTASGTYQLPEA